MAWGGDFDWRGFDMTWGGESGLLVTWTQL